MLPTDRSGVEPTVVFEDQTGAVWVGTAADGLFHYEGTNFTRVRTSHGEILSLGNDDEGNLWVGTGGGGLNRLRTRVVELQAKESGLPSEAVRSICEDQSGVMWAVAENGELARRFGNKWSKVAGEGKWSDGYATCVTSDGTGGVWIGTYHNGLQRWNDGRFASLRREDGLGGEIIRGLLLDHAGDLWIAVEAPACLQKLHENKFQTFTQPNMSRAIRALAEDANGTIWCGTIRRSAIAYRRGQAKVRYAANLFTSSSDSLLERDSRRQPLDRLCRRWPGHMAQWEVHARQ